MSGPPNPKGELIERARTLNVGEVLFDSVAQGPSHEPWFNTVVSVQGREVGRGEGRSKRDAERAASQDALRRLSDGSPQAAAEDALTLPASQAWPIYSEVLSQALLVAHERREVGSVAEVGHDAAKLYRELLHELGVQPGAQKGEHDPDA